MEEENTRILDEVDDKSVRLQLIVICHTYQPIAQCAKVIEGAAIFTFVALTQFKLMNLLFINT